MSFYLNEFKQHLQSLTDKVDHPYDEPARRHLNNPKSIEETYSAMKQPSMGSYQRPAPSMLNEQILPDMGITDLRVVMDCSSGTCIYTVYYMQSGTGYTYQFRSEKELMNWMERHGLTKADIGSFEDVTKRMSRRSMGRGDRSQISNRMPMRRKPTLNPPGSGLPGGGGVP